MIGPTPNFVVDIASREGAPYVSGPGLNMVGVGNAALHRIPSREEQLAIGNAIADRLGLLRQEMEITGAALIHLEDDGSTIRIERHFLYTAIAVDPDEVANAIERSLQVVVDEHGPGRYWTLLRGPVLIYDGDELGARMLRTDSGEVEPHLILRFIYCHERQAKREKGRRR